MGLADVLVPQDQVRAAAMKLAAEIAENSPLGLISTRATMRGDLADRVRKRHRARTQGADRAAQDRRLQGRRQGDGRAARAEFHRPLDRPAKSRQTPPGDGIQRPPVVRKRTLQRDRPMLDKANKSKKIRPNESRRPAARFPGTSAQTGSARPGHPHRPRHRQGQRTASAGALAVSGRASRGTAPRLSIHQRGRRRRAALRHSRRSRRARRLAGQRVEAAPGAPRGHGHPDDMPDAVYGCCAASSHQLYRRGEFLPPAHQPQCLESVDERHSTTQRPTSPESARNTRSQPPAAPEHQNRGQQHHRQPHHGDHKRKRSARGVHLAHGSPAEHPAWRAYNRAMADDGARTWILTGSPENDAAAGVSA